MDIYTALYQATQEYPYYARGFAALTPIKIKNFSTFAVDKYWRLYYSDKSFETFQYCNMAAVICHELEHLLREHEERRNDREQCKWNVACDAEINDDIKGLPDFVIFPSRLKLSDGLTAEEYFNKIKCEITHSICLVHGSGTGEAGDWELTSPKSSDEGICTFEEAEELRAKIASDILSNSEQGTLPDYVKLWAEVKAKGKLPIINWKSFLRRKIRKIINGRDDYHNAKISRRQEPEDRILFPGRISYYPNIYTVIDTSGSMSDQGDWAAGCLKSISQMFKDTKIIDCDTEVHRISKLKSWKDITNCIGGGGTDMRSGITAAIDKRADIIILLTDGYTPWPEPWPNNLIAILPDYKIKYK